MRGPTVFLIGAIAAAALFTLMVLPAFQERTTLRRSLLDAATSEPTAHSDTWRLAKATRAVEAALGPAAEDPEGAVTSIAARTAPGATVQWEAGSLLVTLPFEQLPALLTGLSGPGAPPFLRVRAVPARDGQICLLTLVPEDTTAR